MLGRMSGPDEHVLGGFKPFGLRRSRALCSCGFETRPVGGTDAGAQVDAARRLLIREHGAREPHPGEAVGIPLVGESGLVRPGPARLWTPHRKDPGTERSRRLR
jgi:hypothetical protein